jgi:hypothetical protein
MNENKNEVWEVSGGYENVRTRPKPFSLSSSSTIVSRFMNATPSRLRSCASSPSRKFVCVFGSTRLYTTWFNARTEYPTIVQSELWWD